MGKFISTLLTGVITSVLVAWLTNPQILRDFVDVFITNEESPPSPTAGPSPPGKSTITLEDTTWLIKQNPPSEPKALITVVFHRYRSDIWSHDQTTTYHEEKRPAGWQKTEVVITFHNRSLSQILRGEKGNLQYSLMSKPGLWDQKGSTVTFTIIEDPSNSDSMRSDDGIKYIRDSYRHELRYRGEIVGKQMQGTAVFVNTGEEWKWEAVLR